MKPNRGAKENKGVTMEDRKTLKEWATELKINPINIPPGSENEVMDKEAALGVFERRALGRNIGKLGSWIGKKMGVQAIPEKAMPTIQERIAELQSRNPQLAARLTTVLTDITKEQRGTTTAIDAEIAATKARIAEYKRLGDELSLKNEAAFLKLLNKTKSRQKEEIGERVRP